MSGNGEGVLKRHYDIVRSIWKHIAVNNGRVLTTPFEHYDHDELQFECDNEEEAKEWIKVCEEVAIKVGEEMGAPLPIEAEGKMGGCWGETH